MGETSWDDVGRSFAALGSTLQHAWEQGRDDDKTAAELKSAGEKVKTALDEVAETINRAAGSPEVHAAARQATTSVADALASTLAQVADQINKAVKPKAAEDAKPTDTKPTEDEPSDESTPSSNGDGETDPSEGHPS